VTGAGATVRAGTVVHLVVAKAAMAAVGAVEATAAAGVVVGVGTLAEAWMGADVEREVAAAEIAVDHKVAMAASGVVTVVDRTALATVL